MRIFDCHSHWATETGQSLRTAAERAQQERIWGTPFRFYTEAEQCEYFRAHRARVIGDLSWVRDLPLESMREFHDYALRVQRQNRDVMYGQWLQFNPQTHGNGAIAEFQRCVDQRAGFVGVLVNGQATHTPASDPLWDPFYKASIDAGLPVMIVCGLTGMGQGLPGGKGIVLEDGHPRHIDRVAARFPELRILAGRPAWPWQDEMLAVLRHKANVSYELHGWGPRQFTPALKAEISRKLQDRVMIGCDFPMLTYEKVIGDWKAEGYPEAVLEKVFFRNAESYFPGAGDRSPATTPEPS